MLGPGDDFGEMALFADHRRSASAAPASDCRVWRLPFDAARKLLEHEFDLTRNLLDGAQHRLRTIDERYLQELIQRERLSLVGRMAAELVGDTVPDPENKRRTQLITREVDRLAAMVGDVLDYCRSELNVGTTFTIRLPLRRG